MGREGLTKLFHLPALVCGTMYHESLDLLDIAIDGGHVDPSILFDIPVPDLHHVRVLPTLIEDVAGELLRGQQHENPGADEPV